MNLDELSFRFIDGLFCFHGLLMDITYDRDSKLTCKFWTHVFKEIEIISLSMSLFDYGQITWTNKQVNKIIKDMFWLYVANKPCKWQQLLPIHELAYNSLKHTSTRYNPSMLIYANIHHIELESTQNFLGRMQDMLHSMWGC